MNSHKERRSSIAKNNKLIQAQMESKRNRLQRKPPACIQLCHVLWSPPVPSKWSTSSFDLVSQSPAVENKTNKQASKQNPKSTFNTFFFFGHVYLLSENIPCETCRPRQNAFWHTCPPFKRASKDLMTIACLVLLPCHENFLFASRND